MAALLDVCRVSEEGRPFRLLLTAELPADRFM